MSPSTGLLFWLWKKLFGRRKKLVVLYHMDTVGRGLVAAVSRSYRAVFLKPIMAAADAIIVTSRDYLESSQIGYLAGDPRVVEVPLTADGSRFSPGPVRIAGHALFVGGLDRAHYFKGLDKLLEAFAALKGGAAEAGLTVVGADFFFAEGDRLAEATLIVRASPVRRRAAPRPAASWLPRTPSSASPPRRPVSAALASV
jgi:glycosyltransferase involved in cell wall biosynthesis